MNAWIDSAVIYQVNLRAAAAREPRNPIEAAQEPAEAAAESPLAYLTRGLEALAALGVTVLYLMPPYPIGRAARKGLGSPYSIRDFRDVDPEHGTLEELRQFIARAHALGLRVILDITPNHTARDHVWTRQHPDYYVHAPGGGLYYDFDWSDVAKLDYTRPALRQAMAGVYAYWLGLLGGPDDAPDGVDGFRLDMAHFINDRSFWDEALPRLRARHPDRELLFLAESYGRANNLDLFGRGINAAYDDDFYKVCARLYAVDARGDTTIRLAENAQADADFADRLAAWRAGGIAGAMTRALLNYEDRLPAGANGPWLARYTDNHDEGRGLYRFGPGAARAVNALLFLSGHCLPFLLAGQEFGALNRPSIHERCGPCDKGRRIVTGKSDRAQEGVEFEGNLFARSPADRRGWRDFFRALIALRREQPALRSGAFALLDPGEQGEPADRRVVAFERRLGSRTLACAVNLGPDDRALARPQRFAGRALYGGLRGGVLPAFSACVTAP